MTSTRGSHGVAARCGGRECARACEQPHRHGEELPARKLHYQAPSWRDGRHAATQLEPPLRYLLYARAQMGLVWVSGVCVPGAGLERGTATGGTAHSLPSLSLTPEPRARLRVGPSGNNIEYMQKRTNEEGIDRTRARQRRGRTRHTRTRTDTRTHVRTPLDPSGVFNPGFINSVSAARRVNGDSSLKPRPPGTARTSCTRPCPRPRPYFEEGSRPGAWCSGRRA